MPNPNAWDDDLQLQIADLAQNERQRAWLYHYLDDPARNATEAARKAGYTGTEDSINQMGSRLKAKFLQVIEQYNDRLRDAAIISPREVQTTLANIIRSPQVADRDKLKALELCAKIHGMLSDKLTIEGTVSWKHTLAEALALSKLSGDPKPSLPEPKPIEAEIVKPGASQDDQA
jgi:hypothetical protein